MMKTKLLDKKTTCPFCGEEDFFAYSTENSIEPLPYRGYCSSCGSCITPLEYQISQEQIIADYSNDYSSRVLKNAGIKYDEAAPVKMLERQYITAGLINNNLFKYLSTKFDRNEVKKICNIYGLATHKVGKWFGAAIFYQYNKDDQRQAVKIIQYNENNGHRITGDDKKDEDSDLLYQKPLIEKGKYCLFGLHLLNRPDFADKPVCIVESEKTAIIASIVYPEAVWMAAGSCHYLYNYKIKDFVNDRKIILFPDVDVKYEPIDIDEETGKIRCINWYLIKDNPNEKGLQKSENISTSGFLELFLKEKCKKCSNRKNCSSSPYYSLKDGNEPYKIENRKMGFKLDADPTITEIPKVVLDKLSDVSCEFRGWDLGDYILWCKQQNNQENKLISFEDLIKPIEYYQIDSINDITSELENKLNFQKWECDIRKGITKLPKKQEENISNGDNECFNENYEH